MAVPEITIRRYHWIWQTEIKNSAWLWNCCPAGPCATLWTSAALKPMRRSRPGWANTCFPFSKVIYQDRHLQSIPAEWPFMVIFGLLNGRQFCYFFDLQNLRSSAFAWIDFLSALSGCHHFVPLRYLKRPPACCQAIAHRSWIRKNPTMIRYRFPELIFTWI